MGLFSTLLDFYENMRKTETKVKSTKPTTRKYDFDAGFTGDRKLDCPVYKPSDKKKKQENKDQIQEKDGR